MPEVKSFGERIASDFIVVAKSSDGTNESYVQVIRDEYSGYLFAYPSARHNSESVTRNLLAFLGPYYTSTPMIMCKSDNAREFNTSCSTLGFIHEPTLARRFPHNSTLEREIRTLEEISRAVHVGAGFHIYRDLWQHSVTYAAVVFNAFHPKKDAEGTSHNRYELATGKLFEGQQLILGQLVYARKDRNSRHKFEASAAPALFAGGRFDSGPKSYKGVCYVLDYDAVKQQTPGYQIALADGPPVVPLKAAADRALNLFSEPSPEDIQPTEVPFSELPRDARAGERHEYITLDRIIKYGPSPSCRACENVKGKHTPACRARFDGLIKADKIDASKSTTKAKSIAPSTPAPELPAPGASGPDANLEVTPPYDLPFSAGIPPEETEGRALAARGGAELLWDDAFLQSNRERNMTRRCGVLPGRNVLFEYACSDDSVIGRVAGETNVKCIRLGKSKLDLCNHDHVLQAIEQAESLPGSDAWVSIDCTHYSPIQNLNIHIHGKAYQQKLEARRAQTKVMLAYAIQFAMSILHHHGRVVFELPKDSGI